MPGGFGIWQWNGSAFVAVPGAGMRIAVNPIGMPWLINDQHQIFARDGANWILLPGAANDVGVGLDDTAWVTGTDGVPYYWAGTEFRALPGGATNIGFGANIAADEDGLPWITNTFGNIFQRVTPDAV